MDYINQLRRDGHERNEAIRIAGPTRLRPVLMTTLTTLLGLEPLAIGLFDGAELQAPMGDSGHWRAQPLHGSQPCGNPSRLQPD